KGEGKEYLEFLVKNLKPFIDKQYRTLPGRENTFVAGSSMGGLISMYAILRYPDVFGGAGVFSPAFWVGPAIFDDIRLLGEKARAKIFFYAGDAEGEVMVPDTEKAYELSQQFSGLKATIVIRKEGQHNEARWRAEFPAFYKWMME
ncbi:MAG: alpha/beta hydrolase, partial [Bacteroidia bacterium]|nr:alpha/beta hydrolase [Bacteroidia bacterium]